MTKILSIIGIIGAFFILKYRERVADMLGEAEWMLKIGGVYNFVVILAILIFLWGVAGLTGTLDVLFSPVKHVLPAFGDPSMGEAI